MTWRMIHADCLTAMADMDEASVDAVVTDPPYGLEFMGKEWDRLNADPDIGKMRDVGFEAATGKPDQRAQNEGGTWFGSRGSSAPNYLRTTNAKCRKCGKWRVSGAHDGKGSTLGCQCERPDFPNVRGEAARQSQVWHQAWATEALRVLKPGGHLLAFGGTRTYHRLACALEDAGFEIRDCLAWLYGSGFPKSLDVSKAIDKAVGVDTTADERWIATPHFVTGAMKTTKTGSDKIRQATPGERHLYDPSSEDAERWRGWGTALKPSHEPVVWAVKPQVMLDVIARIGSQLDELEQEWQARGPARRTQTGRAAGSSDQTAMSQSELAVETAWNIASSWRASWVELSTVLNTSTIGTTTRATTDLTTLSSCLSGITHEDIIRATEQPGSSSIVSAADHLFAATVLSLRGTLALSALGSATANTPHSLLDGADPEPAFEPIVLARKPLGGTVAQNVLEHGTGALNIDGTRIEGADDLARESGGWQPDGYVGGTPQRYDNTDNVSPAGRWPANVLLDEQAAAMLDEQSGDTASSPTLHPGRDIDDRAARFFGQKVSSARTTGYEDRGGASRFFYTAKAGRAERNRGLEHREMQPAAAMQGNLVDGQRLAGDGTPIRTPQRANVHPTVKPVDLMQWLCRLITPPGGTILDPFTGSGTTGLAALREGFNFIGIEREADYVEIARDRIIGDAPLFNVTTEVIE